MRRDHTQPFKMISETLPDAFNLRPINVFDIFKATDEFFDENFRAAITLENALDDEGYVIVSPDGFAFFSKILLNAIFGDSVVHVKMHTGAGYFNIEAKWEIYDRISETDLALLRSTAELSGFKMSLSEDGGSGNLILTTPIKRTPSLAIYAVSAAKMRDAFKRVFFA